MESRDENHLIDGFQHKRQDNDTQPFLYSNDKIVTNRFLGGIKFKTFEIEQNCRPETICASALIKGTTEKRPSFCKTSKILESFRVFEGCFIGIALKA